MILFIAVIALVIVVIGLAVYQTIMDDKIKKLEQRISRQENITKMLNDDIARLESKKCGCANEK